MLSKQLLMVLLAILLASSGYSSSRDQKLWSQRLSDIRNEVADCMKESKYSYKSAIVKSGKDAIKISVDVSAYKKLSLITYGTKNGTRFDEAVWANACLTKKNGDKIWVDKLTFKSERTGKGKVFRNENRYGNPLKINGKEYERGVLVHANGEIAIDLNNEFKLFEAEIGIDDQVKKKRGSAEFVVQGVSTVRFSDELNKNYRVLTNSFIADARTDLNSWLTSPDNRYEVKALKRIIGKLQYKGHFQKLFKSIDKNNYQYNGLLLELYERVYSVYECQKRLKFINPDNISEAFENMKKMSGFNSSEYVRKLSQVRKIYPGLLKRLCSEDVSSKDDMKMVQDYSRDILLANPLLDHDKLLLVKYKLGRNSRDVMAPKIGTQKNNWSVHTAMDKKGFDCELVEMNNLRGEPKFRTIYKPKNGASVSCIKLHWDAKKILFTTVSDRNMWNVFEVKSDGTGFNELIKSSESDLDFFDATYLPNGKIIAGTNMGYNGVPCVNGKSEVGNFCLYDPETKDIRRLNFGQDNDWNPVVMSNGRVMYLRWEYTDNTHYFSRIMMHMNPDGTNKKELYGSGSYWPNSMFDAQPLPGKDNNQFVAIVSGHHGTARSGRIVIFDPKKSRHEAGGVIQEIPFKNRKVEPVIKDRLVDGVWPQFIKPYPLSDKYFLVTGKLHKNDVWGLYLVDVYDNVTPIVKDEEFAYTEARPFVKRDTPPVIPEKVNVKDTESTIYIQDIYEGQGTKGIPRGTIKELRILGYEYAYLNSPSNHMAQGIQSGWEIKRMLGTVPVEEDGSVMFKIPANLPISIQPLDKDGAAVQLMRSWLTGMPGEVVSCVGCHENQNTIAKPKFTIASRKQPQKLTPPDGGVRPFTFALEVQPILDRYCISCHNGSGVKPDFKNTKLDKVTRFGKSYLALHPYVNRQGPEADIHTMVPMEYHVSTSDLIKMLKKGHKNVKMADADMRKLYNWIDFNAPYNGTFKAKEVKGCDQVKRRRQLMKKYNNLDIDWVSEIENYMKELKGKGAVKPVHPEKLKPIKHKKIKLRKWPFDAERAKKIQSKSGETTKTINIADGVNLKLVKIPAGKFVMGSTSGSSDEYPMSKVKIKKSFWMGEMEITNQQYKALFPEHDSRYIAQFWKDHVNPGYPANKPQQPVIRVSWNDAMEFCKKLSEKTGLKVTLPTEAQWEWAARSGSDETVWFGGTNSDFAPYSNLADVQLADMAVIGVNPRPMSKDHHLRPYFDFIPRSQFVDDGNMVVASTARYEPNVWGLYDIIGNVWEWTRSDYKSYPYKQNDGRNDITSVNNKVIRGGSWRDRIKKATSSTRDHYKPWQKVFNVGFRVVVEE